MAACTGCTKRNTSIPACTGSDCVQPTAPVVLDAAPPDAGLDSVQPQGDTPDYKTISRNGWSLTVPQEWEEMSVEGEELQPELVVGNEDENNLILLVKDPFPGSTPEYVLAAVKGVKEDGVKITASKQAELNGKKFTSFEIIRGGAKIWFWVIVKDGFGYSLSCGGPASEDHHEAICLDVANSFKIQ